MSEPEQPPSWQPSYQHAPPGQPYQQPAPPPGQPAASWPPPGQPYQQQPPPWPPAYPAAPANPYAYAPASRYTYAPPPSHKLRNVLIGALVVIVVLVAGAVEATGSKSSTNQVSAGSGLPLAQTPTAPSTPAASTAPGPGGVTASSPLTSPRGTAVIFSDDFTDPNSGWDTGADDDSTYTYTPDGYAMTTNAPAIFLSYAPDDTPAQQVSLSVTAIEAPGADPEAGYGVSCRRSADSVSQLRYEFRVTDAGDWYIERNEGELDAQTPTVIAEGGSQLLASSQITVSAVCATLDGGTATRLALFLNGTKVADKVDAGTADGAGWLGAILATNPGTAPATAVVRSYDESALSALPINAANT